MSSKDKISLTLMLMGVFMFSMNTTATIRASIDSTNTVIARGQN